MRRASYEGFNARAIRDYQRIQEVQAYRLLNGLLEHPDQWQQQIQRYVVGIPHGRFLTAFARLLATTMLSVLYGLSSKEVEERHEVVNYINRFIKRMATAAFPGTYLVDLFPSMLHLPRWMAPWRRHGELCYKQDTTFFQGLFIEVRDKVVSWLSVVSGQLLRTSIGEWHGSPYILLGSH